ncbi:futalosine hydrolase [Mucilaginibacter sp. CSA2-8R]|uniref:futalosine hydrolase n=1 Tax=Mucilaginibacter sp. CSA2-8R TaxID=3141542 RepID=UPI00315CF6C6
MKILVVAATLPEIEPLISACGLPVVQPSGTSKSNINAPLQSSPCTVLITGVGMVATAFALGNHLATHRYDLATNLGIAGSFDRSIALGDVTEITQDTFTELGAEDDNRFITLDDLGFGKTTYATPARLSDYSPTLALTQAIGATVNTVHGEENSIAVLQSRIAPQIESMEGAAFFYACQQAGVPALQIRAVSNYVEKRNREAWKIGLAVKNLNNFAINLLQELGCVL